GRRREEDGSAKGKGKPRFRSPGVRGIDMLLGKESVDEEENFDGGVEGFDGGEEVGRGAVRGDSFSFND
ncbi:hypothetical protein HK097_003633, partial [Rhizophlyctis rosea]